ncbi:hypothetical protein FOCC_FOCC011271 [Frankliniella occidentalis]|nr:hypothetical protein FOCC_FOCC011271 [Frankliniella occidentalis]
MPGELPANPHLSPTVLKEFADESEQSKLRYRLVTISSAADLGAEVQAGHGRGISAMYRRGLDNSNRKGDYVDEVRGVDTTRDLLDASEEEA